MFHVKLSRRREAAMYDMAAAMFRLPRLVNIDRFGEWVSDRQGSALIAYDRLRAITREDRDRNPCYAPRYTGTAATFTSTFDTGILPRKIRASLPGEKPPFFPVLRAKPVMRMERVR